MKKPKRGPVVKTDYVVALNLGRGDWAERMVTTDKARATDKELEIRCAFPLVQVSTLERKWRVVE